MTYDQLLKLFFRTFFQEFMELFFQFVAAQLDFTRMNFLDKEAFTDFPRGKRRELDLVAQVYTQEGKPELILVHVEIQKKRDRGFSSRMFEYYAALRLRHRLPIYPIVVYLTPGAGGLTIETHTETLFDQKVFDFYYQVVGLPDLSADDYLSLPNPVAAALSVFMKPKELDRVRQKAQSLKQVSASTLNDVERALLLHLIDTFLKLSERQEREFQTLMGQEELQEVKTMIDTTEEIRAFFAKEGLRRGLRKGRQEGRQEGGQEGRLEGKRDTLLKLLRLKFGELPERVEVRIRTMGTDEELDAVTERVLTAQSLQELGL